MSINLIEKNKQENIDLLQIEQFSNLTISQKEVIVIEPNNTIAITIRKFLVKIGFESIQVCTEVKEGIHIFSHFISNDINTPLIIDSGSNRNIKKTIKEILEIQPNAMIIITTSKDKTSPELQKLFDTGISTILQKPIIFEDLKKSFSNTDEKGAEEDATPEQLEKVNQLQRQIQELESKNETTSQEVTKQPKMEENIVKKIESILLSYNHISDNKFKDIHKIEKSKVDEMIKNSVSNKTIVLDKEISEAACNQCNSTNITYTSECPQCHRINFEQKDLVEHYDCGEIYPKESDYKTCPKCSKNIGSVGTDYREFAGYHICSSCNGRFDRPRFTFSCFDCGNDFIDVLASWKKSKLYKIQK
jgi:DNA-binding NarL/FixJ family response regulator